VLGVERGASEEEIKRAYRRAAQRHHPDVDRSDGAEERFKELNEAYRVLSDRQRRQAYDMFGHAGVEGTAGGWDGFGGGFGPFGDIFDAFFGSTTAGRGTRRRVVAGSDLRYDLTIGFEEAVFGTEKEIRFPSLVRCASCAGSGVEPGTQPERCAECNGSGERRRVSQTILGQMVNITACPRCGGEGTVAATPCTTCHGDGRVSEERTISVKIPAGIDSGQRIALEGHGEAGPRGGPAGDLFVVVKVREHPQLIRRGSELYYELPLTFPQAALGTTVTVPTVDGEQEVEIEPGTQSGHEVRLRGRGVPRLRGGGRGDQHVVVNVVVPQKLGRRERELLEQLGSISAPASIPRGKQASILDRLRDMLG
jgi:molecular chaperone DnaJ